MTTSEMRDKARSLRFSVQEGPLEEADIDGGFQQLLIDEVRWLRADLLEVGAEIIDAIKKGPEA